MRSPLPLLATALLLGATPAAAGSCDHETLAGVAGKAGEVLDRETLPVEATGTVEVVAEQFEVPCGPGEGDEECRGRVEREQAERPREGQTVRVTITTDVEDFYGWPFAADRVYNFTLAP